MDVLDVLRNEPHAPQDLRDKSIALAGALLLAAIFFPLRFGGMAVLTVLFVFAPLACAVGGLISLGPTLGP